MEISSNSIDPLSYLPCCATLSEHKKGQIIYSYREPATTIYLILYGSVKVTKESKQGKQVLIDIYRPEEFFGESAFLKLTERQDQAMAMEDAKVMAWSVQEFEAVVLAQPLLATAMVQTLVRRLNGFAHRIESLAQEHVVIRLARALLHFSTRLGQADTGGTMHMPPLAHTLLCQYVGTSREIITHYMTQFRRRGFLTYSRREICIRGNGLQLCLKREQEKVAAGIEGLDGEDRMTLRQLLPRPNEPTGLLEGGLLEGDLPEGNLLEGNLSEDDLSEDDLLEDDLLEDDSLEDDSLEGDLRADDLRKGGPPDAQPENVFPENQS